MGPREGRSGGGGLPEVAWRPSSPPRPCHFLSGGRGGPECSRRASQNGLLPASPPLPGGGQGRDVTGGGASVAAGCWRRHWSRLGLRAPLRSRRLGRSYLRVRSWFLARQRHGVRGDVEAAHGVRGGAAEPWFPEAAALRPSAWPHSGPQAPGR